MPPLRLPHALRRLARPRLRHDRRPPRRRPSLRLRAGTRRNRCHHRLTSFARLRGRCGRHRQATQYRGAPASRRLAMRRPAAGGGIRSRKPASRDESPSRKARSPARGEDAPRPAGETPALRFSAPSTQHSALNSALALPACYLFDRYSYISRRALTSCWTASTSAMWLKRDSLWRKSATGVLMARESSCRGFSPRAVRAGSWR